MEDIKQQHKAKPKLKDSKVSKQTHIVEETTTTGEKRYHCTECRKTFRSRSQKYYHLNCNQLHDMLYKCDHCDKCFARPSQWKYHVESHTSPINNCPKCQKTFSNPLALKKHEGLHKVKPKPCPHCEKTFQKKISLDQHIAAQHLNQLQFGCAYCNKKYSSKSTLQLHLQSHEKKRFECTICGKHFQRNSILNLHLKRHYHTNNYSCPVCHKIFSESGALSRHRKIHEENVLQYHCKLCNKNILRKDNMTRHLNTIHPEEKFEDIVDILRLSPDKTYKPKSEKMEVRETGSDREIINNKEGYNNTEKQININIATTSYEKCVILENKIIQKPIKNQYEVINETSQIPDELMVIDGHVSSSYNQINTNMNDQLIVNQIQVITPVLPQHDGKGQNLINNENASQELLEYNIVETGQQLEYTILKTHKEDIQKNATYTQLTDIANYNKTQDILNHHMDFIEMPTDILKPAPDKSEHRTKQLSKECDSFKTPDIQHYFLFNDNINTNEIENLSNFSKTTESRVKSNISQVLYPVPKEQEEYRNEFAEQLNIHGPSVTPTISSVIKSIGNVKKNLTPTIVKGTKIISKAVTTTKPTLYSLNLEYKHKKYSRNNYDIDLYRKILGCDEVDDDNNYSENDDSHQLEVYQQQRSIKSSSNKTTNAISTPVHWRKSFKNNYETSAS